MSYHPADGAALVAAAVQAAIRERAPRRTVAAVAAAVAGTVLSAAARPSLPATKPKVYTQDAQSLAEDADDPAQLLASLRAVRRAQRVRKKQRRREAKQAALNSQRSTPSEPQLVADVSLDAGTAGQCAEHVGASAAVPAPVPKSSTAVPSSTQPHGLHLLPAPHAALSAAGSLGSSSVPSTARPLVATASRTASAGMPHSERSAPYIHHPPNTKSKPGRR